MVLSSRGDSIKLANKKDSKKWPHIKEPVFVRARDKQVFHFRSRPRRCRSFDHNDMTTTHPLCFSDEMVHDPVKVVAELQALTDIWKVGLFPSSSTTVRNCCRAAIRMAPEL